jgi:hypothetical protein
MKLLVFIFKYLRVTDTFLYLLYRHALVYLQLEQVSGHWLFSLNTLLQLRVNPQRG